MTCWKRQKLHRRDAWPDPAANDYTPQFKIPYFHHPTNSLTRFACAWADIAIRPRNNHRTGLVPDEHRNLRIRQPALAALGDEVAAEPMAGDVSHLRLAAEAS